MFRPEAGPQPPAGSYLQTRANEEPGSTWSARSEARTNDVDAGDEWRRIDQEPWAEARLLKRRMGTQQ
jgi:hypothetical protein